MDNLPTPEQKNVKRKRVWSWIIVIVVFLGFQLISYKLISDKDSTLVDAQKQLLLEQQKNSTCVFKRDSLAREVKILSIYQSLSKAMVHRDEATKLLKYKVGDVVFSKRDSSKVVISDIVIGGSQYEYYVKYRLLHKDSSTEDVLPELVY
jgi:hypothetical protein